MNRTEILKKANECVTGDREQDYGSPENNFSLIAALWEPYLKAKCLEGEYDLCICPEDVATMMALIKIARIASGRPHEDNFIDLAGYAACAGEIATNEERHTKTNSPKVDFCKHDRPTICEIAKELKRILGMEDPCEREYTERKKAERSNPPDVIKYLGYSDWLRRLEKAMEKEDIDELQRQTDRASVPTENLRDPR